MKTVWKYQSNREATRCVFHEDFKVRLVALQNDVPCIWVEHDTDGPTEDWIIDAILTGRTVPEDGTFFGSLIDGPFVWHLYGRKHETNFD